jgi:hypothetical protein
LAVIFCKENFDLEDYEEDIEENDLRFALPVSASIYQRSYFRA